MYLREPHAVGGDQHHRHAYAPWCVPQETLGRTAQVKRCQQTVGKRFGYRGWRTNELKTPVRRENRRDHLLIYLYTARRWCTIMFHDIVPSFFFDGDEMSGGAGGQVDLSSRRILYGIKQWMRFGRQFISFPRLDASKFKFMLTGRDSISCSISCLM